MHKGLAPIVAIFLQITICSADNVTDTQISKCCRVGEYFLMKDDSNERVCVKQPLHFRNDIRRYNSYLREFEVMFNNPCEG